MASWPGRANRRRRRSAAWTAWPAAGWRGQPYRGGQGARWEASPHGAQIERLRIDQSTALPGTRHAVLAPDRHSGTSGAWPSDGHRTSAARRPHRRARCHRAAAARASALRRGIDDDVSNETTCASAWTPASVRPAAVTRTGCSSASRQRAFEHRLHGWLPGALLRPARVVRCRDSRWSGGCDAVIRG